MYKVFYTIESLYQGIEEDKNWTGAESAMRNRYPLRFVLFENFSDFYSFTAECQNHNVLVQSMEQWMSKGNDDSLLTYSQLGAKFKAYIESVPANDFVIAPFSEIARFYDNSEKNTEFDSLVKTIRLIESYETAQHSHQRIYVPIIGMQSKMDKFKNDPNIHIWEYHSEEQPQNYHLILTQGTLFNVQGLKSKYSVCESVKEWIALWRKGGDVRQTIICSSKSIYNNARYAQPDNAFDYTICSNAFEFLRDGLGINFGDIVPSEEDMAYWEQMAGNIIIDSFDFLGFVRDRFNVSSIDSIEDFLQIWEDNKDGYSRWLLKTYYILEHDDSNYLRRVLTKSESSSSSDLYSTISTLIFSEHPNSKTLSERLSALREGAKLGVQITSMAEKNLIAKLTAIAADPEGGYHLAMQYMSPISASEKRLMIVWLGEGKIQRQDIKTLYPELYYYTEPFSLQFEDNKMWVNSYFSEYCNSKISNQPTDRLIELLNIQNSSDVSFETWRNEFKTVKTLLHGREDIDVYYWIDGLGIDWIPFIRNVVAKHEVENVFLNEVHIAAALLPTRTSNNKTQLQELCRDKLQKIGDIDSFAHQHKEYPNFIDEEFSQVESVITDVLAHYNGKKIAFVSDHGISYMANHAKGLNIAGIKSDHAGRCGEWEKGSPTKDRNYIVLENGKTMCSLTHKSLTTKVPEGQGAHGGATPEEVLVPIIIISSQRNTSNYSAVLQNFEITASSPFVSYVIKGLSSIDVPVVEYNGVDYSLKRVSDNKYLSEELNLVGTANKLTLKIGAFKQNNTINVKLGVDEEDIFGEL